jgi:hypothetical protein
VAFGVSVACAEDGFADLFNGKDLTGWETRGGNASYTVEDGVLVGSSVPNTANSFLCTKQAYGDFILELDFNVDPALNSGVQFRSECFDVKTALTDKTGQPLKNSADKPITVAAHRVHGYQYEIDLDPAKNRWWTGGIYDEGRRGWLFPGMLGGDAKAFTAQGASLHTPADGWNHLRIEAVGSSIKTWLNGEPRATITDDQTPSGFIGLQVHSIGKDEKHAGLKARFRNIRIKPVQAAPNTLDESEKAAGWSLLWDGKTSEGWRSSKSDTFPSGGWKMDDGVLTVVGSDGKESARGGDIITRAQYSNFELKADFKITPGANSGIKIFVQPELGAITGTGAKTAVGSAIGLEYQILDDLRHPDAKLGHNGDRTLGSLYDLIPAASSKKPNPIGEWNHALIVSRGKHVEFWLNGEKVTEFERGSPAFRDEVAASKYKHIPGFGEWSEGHILLQDHGNTVSFRNIKIRTLTAE